VSFSLTVPFCPSPAITVGIGRRLLLSNDALQLVARFANALPADDAATTPTPALLVVLDAGAWSTDKREVVRGRLSNMVDIASDADPSGDGTLLSLLVGGLSVF
jgi:hypothetical protein